MPGRRLGRTTPLSAGKPGAAEDGRSREPAGIRGRSQSLARLAEFTCPAEIRAMPLWHRFIARMFPLPMQGQGCKQIPRGRRGRGVMRLPLKRQRILQHPGVQPIDRAIAAGPAQGGIPVLRRSHQRNGPRILNPRCSIPSAMKARNPNSESRTMFNRPASPAPNGHAVRKATPNLTRSTRPHPTTNSVCTRSSALC